MQGKAAGVETERKNEPRFPDAAAHGEPGEVQHGDVDENSDPDRPAKHHQEDAGNGKELKDENDETEQNIAGEQQHAVALKALGPTPKPAQGRLPGNRPMANENCQGPNSGRSEPANCYGQPWRRFSQPG